RQRGARAGPPAGAPDRVRARRNALLEVPPVRHRAPPCRGDRPAARSARRLEETCEMDLPSAWSRLQAFPGVGPWTAAKVALVALGDADAVPVGDYHLPHMVGFAFDGT